MEAQSLQRRTREQEEQHEESLVKGKEAGEEYAQEKDDVEAKSDAANPEPEHFGEVAINSNHSSEDESRRRNASPASTSEASG